MKKDVVSFESAQFLYENGSSLPKESYFYYRKYLHSDQYELVKDKIDAVNVVHYPAYTKEELMSNLAEVSADEMVVIWIW